MVLAFLFACFQYFSLMHGGSCGSFATKFKIISGKSAQQDYLYGFSQLAYNVAGPTEIVRATYVTKP